MFLDRYSQIVPAVLMGGVDIVCNCNKADPISGKHPPQVAPGFDVFSPQAGKVFDYDRS